MHIKAIVTMIVNAQVISYVEEIIVVPRSSGGILIVAWQREVSTIYIDKIQF